MDSQYSPLLAVVLTAVGYYIGIFIHECGHLAAAVVCGWKPLTLCMGGGRRLGVVKLGDLHLEFASFPFVGHALSAPSILKRYRWCEFLVCSGGPAATAMFLWALWNLATTPEWMVAMPVEVQKSILWGIYLQAFILAGTLLPWLPQLHKREVCDGRRMLNALTSTTDDLKKLFLRRRWGGGLTLLGARQAGICTDDAPSDGAGDD